MNSVKKYIPEITGGFVFIVYLFTLAPGVMNIDSGELATVLSLPGIAHPSGYPLFTLLGFLFTLIPLPFDKIFILNISAALYVSAGIAVFVRSGNLLLNNFSALSDQKPKQRKRSKKNKTEEPTAQLEENAKILASVFGGLLLAFSVTVWNQSTSVEVYSLHFLMLNLILFFTLKSFYTVGDSRNNWMLLAVMLALGFSNHLTTMLTLPGLAYLFFKRERFSASAYKTLGKMLAVFFPVLALIYSYLPLRAADNPLLNWGNPVDWESFLRHVSGKQYRVWMFSSFDSAGKQFGYFLSNLPVEFAYIGLIPILLGFYFLWKRSRTNFNFIFITFAVTVFYAVNYDIHDIDSYFLLAYLSAGLAGSAGFAWVFANKRFSENFRSAVNIPILLILVLIALNFLKTSKHGNYIYSDYTKAVLHSVEENAVIFSYQWDYLVSPALYYQNIEKIRTDVRIIDKELLRRVWYFNQLEQNYPDIFSGLQTEKNQFLGQLVKFEQDEMYNPSLIERYYRNLMTGLVRGQIKSRSFYIGPELYGNEMQQGQFTLPEGLTLVPNLFMYKVVKGSEYVPAPEPDFSIRFEEFEDNYISNLKNMISLTLINRALYELQYGFESKSISYMNKAVEISPTVPIPPALRKLASGS